VGTVTGTVVDVTGTETLGTLATLVVGGDVTGVVDAVLDVVGAVRDAVDGVVVEAVDATDCVVDDALDAGFAVVPGNGPDVPAGAEA
jgi:hypothetical protein